MKLKDCRQCKYHVDVQFGEVLCKYWGQLSSLATDMRDQESHLVVCPKETTRIKAS